MPADAMWNLCMAINVYLTIFKKYNTDDLKSLEWIYLLGRDTRGPFTVTPAYYWLANYGGPFIPAFIYCFISNSENGRIYANATLWCWVSPQWDYLRVATLYGPAWYVDRISLSKGDLTNRTAGFASSLRLPSMSRQARISG